MKKSLVFIAILTLLSTAAFAQKIGYVNTEDIMSQIPEYNSAQEEVDRFSTNWQEQLEKKYAEIERMYKEYTAQEVLLPEDIKLEKQEEIFQAEREAKEYRESKFGYNGALFKLQENKIKPIQDKVFKSVEVIAKRKKINLVFDKAGEVTWLYTDATYDMSEEVLKELGYGKDDK